jgi:hypothetical protein
MPYALLPGRGCNLSRCRLGSRCPATVQCAEPRIRVQDGATILGVGGLSNEPEGHPTLLEKPRPLSPVYYDDILGLKRMTRSLFRGQR